VTNHLGYWREKVLTIRLRTSLVQNAIELHQNTGIWFFVELRALAARWSAASSRGIAAQSNALDENTTKNVTSFFQTHLAQPVRRLRVGRRECRESGRQSRRHRKDAPTLD
jgi:hypothetical protein